MRDIYHVKMCCEFCVNKKLIEKLCFRCFVPDILKKNNLMFKEIKWLLFFMIITVNLTLHILLVNEQLLSDFGNIKNSDLNCLTVEFYKQQLQ